MIPATFVGAFRKRHVTRKSPFEGLSSAPGTLKSAFSRHNSLVSNVLTDQADCEIGPVHATGRSRPSEMPPVSAA
jgi:hypothetical protein